MIKKRLLILICTITLLCIFCSCSHEDEKNDIIDDTITLEYIDGTKLSRGIGDKFSKAEIRDLKYIYFGKYPQTEITGNNLTDEIRFAEYDDGGIARVGDKIYKRLSKASVTNEGGYGAEGTFDWSGRFFSYFLVEPIRWEVIYNSDGFALLLSEKGLDCQKFNEERCDITWSECTLRSWLNGEFLSSAFSKDEEKRIMTAELKNYDNPYYETEGGEDTSDRIFLLALEDVVNLENISEAEYLKTGPIDKDDYRLESAGNCIPTDFSKAMGTYFSENDTSEWWLRTHGEDKHASTMYSDGYMDIDGAVVSSDELAIRPAIYINLSAKADSEFIPVSNPAFENGGQIAFVSDDNTSDVYKKDTTNTTQIDKPSDDSEEETIICKKHTYNSQNGNICLVCGYEFVPEVTEVDKVLAAVKNNVKVRTTYYDDESALVYKLKKGQEVHVVGELLNSLGSRWYLTDEGYYIFVDNLEEKKQESSDTGKKDEKKDKGTSNSAVTEDEKKEPLDSAVTVDEDNDNSGFGRFVGCWEKYSYVFEGETYYSADESTEDYLIVNEDRSISFFYVYNDGHAYSCESSLELCYDEEEKCYELKYVYPEDEYELDYVTYCISDYDENEIIESLYGKIDPYVEFYATSAVWKKVSSEVENQVKAEIKQMTLSYDNLKKATGRDGDLWIYNDFNYDGKRELFVVYGSYLDENDYSNDVTGESNWQCSDNYADVSIWFADNNGECSEVASGIWGYLRGIADIPGKRKFLIWELDAGGSSSLSEIYSVDDDGQYFISEISGKGGYFVAKDGQYSLEISRWEDGRGHLYYSEDCYYDNTAGDFYESGDLKLLY